MKAGFKLQVSCCWCWTSRYDSAIEKVTVQAVLELSLCRSCMLMQPWSSTTLPKARTYPLVCCCSAEEYLDATSLYARVQQTHIFSSDQGSGLSPLNMIHSPSWTTPALLESRGQLH